MLRLVEQEQPRQVFHLGDLVRDAQALQDDFPALPVALVPGNCDGWTTLPSTLHLTLGGFHFLLSHGHLWDVKRGYEAAIAAGRKAGAHVVLFGHTHQPLCRQLEDGMWLLNPGPSRSSYGVIRLEEGQLSCAVLPVESPTAPGGAEG